MNKVMLVGRLTRDPEVRYTAGENATCTARFSLAVNRKFKNAEGAYDADFINCVAFGKTGEFVEKFFKKGSAIGVTGRIQTGSYMNKEQQRVYTTDVVVEDAEFVESRNAGNTGVLENQKTQSNADFMRVPDDAGEEMPF